MVPPPRLERGLSLFKDAVSETAALPIMLQGNKKQVDNG